MYEFYFGSCMNIIFNELRHQQNKTYTPFFITDYFYANLSAILIGTIL